MNIRRSIGCAVAAVAIAAPAAQATSLDAWAYWRVRQAASPPLRGEHSFGHNRPLVRAGQLDPWAYWRVLQATPAPAPNLSSEHTHGQYRPQRSATPAPVTTQLAEPSGFHWTDAGIGAASAAALMLISGGAAAGIRRTQRRQASA